MAKTYTVNLTEAEVEMLVRGLRITMSNDHRHGNDDTSRSSSNERVRGLYALEDRLYTALLAEYRADLDDRAAEAAEAVLRRHA